MTVAEALRFAAEALAAAGIDETRRTASLLVELAVGVDRAAIVARPERVLTPDEAARLDDAVRRRADGEPFQYIAGVQEFYFREFEVTPDVLIPRPETEHIVEEAIRAWSGAGRVLDVGTGSGCIAVTLAKELAGARVVATDVSAGALDVARCNAARHAADVAFVRCDLATALAGAFELVVSNPPYVDPADRATLQREVVEHEPHLALFAEDRGFAIYRRLFADAPRLLAPTGRLVVEIGFGQEAELVGIAVAAGLAHVTTVRDLAGIPRTMVFRNQVI